MNDSRDFTENHWRVYGSWKSIAVLAANRPMLPAPPRTTRRCESVIVLPPIDRFPRAIPRRMARRGCGRNGAPRLCRQSAADNQRAADIGLGTLGDNRTSSACCRYARHASSRACLQLGSPPILLPCLHRRRRLRPTFMFFPISACWPRPRRFRHWPSAPRPGVTG